ncbi:MAG: hypothetical protein P5702_24140 [Limnospira sp. PMC 1291.21]|uniref:hypothetical protein n=2 Tax=Limnospira TaxID=2596745 RepID=UPI0028E11ADF|nr:MULTISPECIES: hypothetical protein [unclassified Limnospira]MDT9297902.1 hypothetical protein [Arthrospira platensis PCC 7345]MDT9180518.1 hypothetical protein [Limnospira sp. PMC 1238.20]MDT9195899.1 hypothetical protein [Limnospira sp. PMC 1245.20]MDT9206141.1 hypothetical protein [Limnospira sp. PMC 1243.20]MDT9211272.1 hypothetical protein [Limnospira sp. PMC 1252.20]
MAENIWGLATGTYKQMNSQMRPLEIFVLLLSTCFVLLVVLPYMRKGTGQLGSRMLHNGVHLYKSVVEYEIETNKSFHNYLRESNFISSTYVFKTMLKDNIIINDPFLFHAPGVEKVDDIEQLSSKSNPWSIGFLSEPIISSAFPLFFSRNINENELIICLNGRDCTLENIGSRAENGYIFPFDQKALVVIYSDGSSRILQKNTLIWNIFNLNGVNGIILNP